MSENRIGIIRQLVPQSQLGPRKACRTRRERRQHESPPRTHSTTFALADCWCLQVLLSKGAKVYMATRSEEKAQRTIYELKHGVMYMPFDRVTSQGYDLQFGTNVLGHFYLTKLLLPVLTVTAKKAPEKTVRVVNLSVETIRLRNARNLAQSSYSGRARLALSSFRTNSTRRYGGEGIVSIPQPGQISPVKLASLVGRIE
ncbi:hypothetical protein F5148DRAFT_1254992 [Russula earlei]|uniref:Uncharacterized protein n=1 Tax=Russula earlei TaxID=71964 RepID=A0ACC0TSY1_9AGAM|nr:hypothetical protein F5148DRAFT_1254992 [Russula earlei]